MNLQLIGTAGLLSLGALTLAAAPVTGTAVLTADNHYGLYTGLADGSDLSLVGRNEQGFYGDPGTYNWSLPETWSVSLDAGQHLFVVAWDHGGPQSWIGQFTFGSETLYTDLSHWEFLVGSGPNPGENGDLPETGDLMIDISAGAWSPVTEAVPYGTSPWGSIAGLDAAAEFIWSDTFGETAGSDSSYVIFRTSSPIVESQSLAAAPIPEANTVAAGAILAGLVGLSLRRRQLAVRHQ